MTQRRLPKIAIEDLLAPISDLLPSGESLRRGPIYDKIKEARREDDPTIDHGIWQVEPKSADWDAVIKLGADALKTKSKDLRIAGWLTEAWIRKYGLPGAAHGMQLLTALVSTFWDTIHPQIDDDGDLDARIAPFGWMNKQLALRLKQIPLIDPSKHDGPVLDLLAWEKASVLERSGKSPTGNQVSTQEFMTAVMLSPIDMYRSIAADCEALQAAVKALEEAVDTRCGEPVASLYQVREVIETLNAFVKRILKHKGADESEAAEEDAIDDAAGGDTPMGPSVNRGPIRNRAEAYQRLAEAAEYLAQLEPHSPVPHLIKRAVAWGNLPFSDLIRELVQDRNSMFAIYNLLGLGDPNKR